MHCVAFSGSFWVAPVTPGVPLAACGPLGCLLNAVGWGVVVAIIVMTIIIIPIVIIVAMVVVISAIVIITTIVVTPTIVVIATVSCEYSHTM